MISFFHVNASFSVDEATNKVFVLRGGQGEIIFAQNLLWEGKVALFF